jgi:hypothetical protein
MELRGHCLASSTQLFTPRFIGQHCQTFIHTVKARAGVATSHFLSAVGQKPSIDSRNLRASKPATLTKAKQLHWPEQKQVQWRMSNVLNVSLQTTIYSLLDRECWQRRIALENGVDRETVSLNCRLSKPAISSTWIEGIAQANQPFRPPGARANVGR